LDNLQVVFICVLSSDLLRTAFDAGYADYYHVDPVQHANNRNLNPANIVNQVGVMNEAWVQEGEDTEDVNNYFVYLSYYGILFVFLGVESEFVAHI